MKITRKQYQKAKQIVSEYEAQFSLSFVRGSFKASDLEIYHYGIRVPKVKESDVTDERIGILYNQIDEKISCDWATCEDEGYLTIGFRDMQMTDKHINAVLEALNNL